MLTAEENDLLCRVEGDAPMGQLMRRHWMPACLIEEVAGAGRGAGRGPPAGRGPGGVPRYRRPRRRAGRILPAPRRARWCSAATRNAACAACITAGRWTSKATWSTCPPSRRKAASPKSQAQGLSDARARRLCVGVHGAQGRRCRRSRRRRGRPQRRPASALSRSRSPCNWAQILEGAIDSAHSSTLHSTDMPPARVDGAKATAQQWLRPSTDKAPRMLAAADRLRVPLRRGPPADQERGDP